MMIELKLTEGEKAACSTVAEWLRQARSSTAIEKLSALVEDPGAWNGRRVVFHKRGTLAWGRLCLLREYVRRRGGLREFSEMLKLIEGEKVVDIPSVQTACKLVEQFVMIGVMARSREYAKAHPIETALALRLAPKIRDDAIPPRKLAAR